MSNPIRITAPGIYPSMSAEIYHSDPAPEPSLSSTAAKALMGQSPLHAWVKSPRLNPDWEPTHKEEFDLGTACHTMLMGDGPKIDRLDFTDRRTAAYKEAVALARAARMTPLLAADYDRAESMMEAVAAHLEEAGIPDGFNRNAVDEVECSAFAQVDGIWCRARADAIIWPKNGRPGVIRDFKTVGGTAPDASPEGACKAVSRLGYDLQTSHYVSTFQEAWEAETGERAKFVFQFGIFETVNPFLGIIAELADEWQEFADKLAARAREQWAYCMRTGNFPGYPTSVVILEPPIWLARRAYERLEFETAHKSRTGQDVLDEALQFQSPLPAAE
ncbi:MAG: PD-(D/E)XK nuclease-like domain-containing protein [Pseudomonadota bacterium]